MRKIFSCSTLPLAAALMGIMHNVQNDGAGGSARTAHSADGLGGSGGGVTSGLDGKTFSPDIGGSGGVTSGSIDGGAGTISKKTTGIGDIVDTGGTLGANKDRVRVPGSA